MFVVEDGIRGLISSSASSDIDPISGKRLPVEKHSSLVDVRNGLRTLLGERSGLDERASGLLLGLDERQVGEL